MSFIIYINHGFQHTISSEKQLCDQTADKKKMHLITQISSWYFDKIKVRLKWNRALWLSACGDPPESPLSPAPCVKNSFVNSATSVRFIKGLILFFFSCREMKHSVCYQRILWWCASGKCSPYLTALSDVDALQHILTHYKKKSQAYR